MAVSPIVGGQALRGPAGKLLEELGHEVSCTAIARLYKGMCDLFVIDEVDSAQAAAIEALGMRAAVTKTVMETDWDKTRLAINILDLLEDVPRETWKVWSVLTPTSVIAIVPMKPLSQGKSRLSPRLNPAQREALSGNLLQQVLRAVWGSRHAVPGNGSVEQAWVVGGDPGVKRLAAAEGAAWYEEDGGDINETLGLAFRRALDEGRTALFLPGDLPFLKPTDVYGILEASGKAKNVTLAPARLGGGTNGILVPPGLTQPFHPQLGIGSFQRHLSQAGSLGLPVALYYSPGLAFDLDTAEDLEAGEFIAPGLTARLTGDEKPAPHGQALNSTSAEARRPRILGETSTRTPGRALFGPNS